MAHDLHAGHAHGRARAELDLPKPRQLTAAAEDLLRHRQLVLHEAGPSQLLPCRRHVGALGLPAGRKRRVHLQRRRAERGCQRRGVGAARPRERDAQQHRLPHDVRRRLEGSARRELLGRLPLLRGRRAVPDLGRRGPRLAAGRARRVRGQPGALRAYFRSNFRPGLQADCRCRVGHHRQFCLLDAKSRRLLRGAIVVGRAAQVRRQRPCDHAARHDPRDDGTGQGLLQADGHDGAVGVSWHEPGHEPRVERDGKRRVFCA